LKEKFCKAKFEAHSRQIVADVTREETKIKIEGISQIRMIII